MENNDIDIDAIERLVEQVEGIILLDLKGVHGTWKEHVDAIYAKMQEIREVCGINDR
ncbi:hypothetical protein [Agrobacterium pusense]|uniref:hypothetical protein n=1 Tax=Agrobacterium pusense TaxID=648995 RepID=UPI00146A7315|nr:hypothetical protein [Agrobacterium pusense]WCK26635.1 hypothetical protein CFBP5496_0020765 [Agrobacterium pusense]